jgi:RNA polymerase sigma factor (sigma-70 family)
MLAINQQQDPEPAAATIAAAAKEASHLMDAGAPGEMYLAHAQLLRRVAIRKFQVPPGDAESLVHDVFINYLRTERTVRSDVRGYLVASICNACRNYWRARRSEERVFVGGGDPERDAVGEDMFDGLAVNLLVASTLARLGDRCRDALKRYYLDGEDTATIAAALNTSPANVNYMMHVCRKRARAIYEEIARPK